MGACVLATQEVKAGRPWIRDQPGAHSKTVPQNETEMKMTGSIDVVEQLPVVVTVLSAVPNSPKQGGRKDWPSALAHPHRRSYLGMSCSHWQCLPGMHNALVPSPAPQYPSTPVIEASERSGVPCHPGLHRESEARPLPQSKRKEKAPTLVWCCSVLG